MRVLVIGMDQTTATFLRQHGIGVELQQLEGAEDLELWLIDNLYDACVIDIEASDVGIYAARGLREKNIDTPILGISRGVDARSWSDHRALFLENGGDDLLHGPVNPRELIASLRAARRRFTGALLDIFEHRVAGAHLKINLTLGSVTVNDREVSLTGKERALMLLFAAAPGRVLSKELLLMQLYANDSIDDQPEMKIIDVFICKVRRKLSEHHPDAGSIIKTVWGRGYTISMRDPPLVVSDVAA